MTDVSDSVTFLGLTGAGKTHYLVALDVVLTKGKVKDSDALEHHSAAADRTYLQPLRQKWMKGEDLGRTFRNDPPPAQKLLTIHKKSGKVVALTLPDMAGEEFVAQFTTRTLSKAFEQQVRESNGFLLFVHCEQDSSHTILENHPELLTFVGGEEAKDAPEPSDDAVQEAIESWTLELASRQVKIVDLLQFIESIRGVRWPVKIAVMISAWDVVERMIQQVPAAAAEFPSDPALFLEKRWPLLNQYLTSRKELFDFKVYGVSARGGGTSPEEVKRLTENFVRPEDRVVVVHDAHRSNDLTLPIRWLVGIAS